MEIVETQEKITTDKKFTESQITLINRKALTITGVERVYETNESKILLKVAGSNLQIMGETLNITRLDVEAGVVQVEGLISDLKYTNVGEKGSFFKKIFK